MDIEVDTYRGAFTADRLARQALAAAVHALLLFNIHADIVRCTWMKGPRVCTDEQLGSVANLALKYWARSNKIVEILQLTPLQIDE